MKVIAWLKATVNMVFLWFKYMKDMGIYLMNDGWRLVGEFVRTYTT